MVSELAGKGAVPPQLPEPASRRLEIAHHSDRFRQQIRRGSLLYRGVTKMKSNNASGVNSSPASFGLRRTFKVAESSLQKLDGPGAAVDGGGLLIVKASKHDSLHAIDSFSLLFLHINADRSAMLVDLLFAGSRSRSAESTMSAELIVTASLPQWRTRKKNQMCTILFVAFISCSRSVESMSAELINRSSMAIVVPSPLVLKQWRSWSRSMKNSSRVLVNPLFIAFDCRSWSRSVEIDDNSSKEIEDKAENLDDDDGEELTAVNKIRCGRFVFDDEEEQEEQKDEIDVDQPEDSEKTSFNSSVQQHSSQQPWFSRQNGGSKSLCSDLEVDHIDIQILMLVWKMQAQKQSVKNAINAHAINIPLYAVLDIGLDTEVDMNVFNEGRPVGVEGLDLEVQEIMDILVYYLQGGQVGDSEIVFEMQQISETVATVLGMQHAKLQSSFVLIGLIAEKESFNAATTWFFVPKKACVHEVAVQFLVSLHTYAGKRAIVDKLVRKVAAKTNGLAGDGTTTTVVLAQGLSDEGVKIVAAVALYLRKVGAEIVKRALSYPLKLIAKTAGVNESVVSEKVFSSDNSKYEYNASAAKLVGSGCMLTLKPMCWITFQVCIASWCSECIFLMLELKSEKEKAEIRFYDPSQKGFAGLVAFELGRTIHGLVIKACIDDCERTFCERPKRNLITCWSTLVGDYAHQGHANMALDLTSKTQDVMSNYITFVHVLTACSRVGAVETSLNIDSHSVLSRPESSLTHTLSLSLILSWTYKGLHAPAYGGC